ncbi:MAG: hypothetical protein GC201_02190 [Alphaproteobacteria bacterium]|nr:hypothetical protein [Alphaproteobacteria bacterium]
MTSPKAPSPKGNSPFVLRGKTIREDENGLVNLSDIYQAAGKPNNKRPAQWGRLDTAVNFIIAVHERVVGKSHKGAKMTMKPVYYTSAIGTYGHALIAASYAAYLSPKLAIEMKQVWLRYRAGDPTLADEILERATDEGNEWAATRALGRVKRNEYTQVLSKHEVERFGYGNCTNAVYTEVLGGTAKQLRARLGVPKSGNLRDKLTTDELVFVMAAEVLAKQRINDEDPRGNVACERATKRSAAFIKKAIMADQQDRKPKMI